MRRGLVIGLTVVAMTAAGCGGGGDGGGSQSKSVPRGELVSLSRTGQAPGANVSIVVRPDRHVLVTSPAGVYVSRLGPATFESMQGELASAPVAKLDAKDELALPPAVNSYRYTIAYHGRLVHWEQGSTPSSLKRTFSDVSPFFSSAPTDGTPLVRVRRAGGPAPTRVAVRVTYGGRAQRSEEALRMRSRDFRLSRATLERLKAAVADVELAEIPSSSEPAPAGGYVYEISTGRRTIRAPQGRLPSQLARVIALVPLVLITRRRDLMGKLVNRRLTTVLTAVVAALIIALNAFLLLDTFLG